MFGHIPTAVVNYTVAIHACGKASQGSKAVELLRRMEERGVQPQVVTYNAVITALGGRGRWEEAIELLREMADRHDR